MLGETGKKHPIHLGMFREMVETLETETENMKEQGTGCLKQFFLLVLSQITTQFRDYLQLNLSATSWRP